MQNAPKERGAAGIEAAAEMNARAFVLTLPPGLSDRMLGLLAGLSKQKTRAASLAELRGTAVWQTLGKYANDEQVMRGLARKARLTIKARQACEMKTKNGER